MKMVILLLLLVIPWYAVTYLSVEYNWSPAIYFLTMLGTGAILGYISGKAGYEC